MSLRHTLLLIALASTGCDQITGVANQKILDAEAIGYACRVSSKAPADCISDNETHSPTSLLAGWKAADQDILAKLLDPSMGKDPAQAAHSPASTSAPGASKHADTASAAEDMASAADEKTHETNSGHEPVKKSSKKN